jgi:predicted Fe-Mo cluster-binding NifX family protein
MIPLMGDLVAPRFDMAPEVVVVLTNENEILEERTYVMSRPSPESICQMAISERINILVCCGIEEEFYQYLKWKKVEVYDCVLGPYRRAISKLLSNSLRSNEVLMDRSH